ncbi:MAG: hypothetical protein UW44_C0008G0124 [Candidatus Collierbacteria bacterium GW2011_GWB2_44_22]|uniref:Uncharacterized protein n=1 Tax=Candidatus Collierbacteria bacterium GW2011_GWB2_44_22 TaxID=1618387 RepID=A0A0G1K643_9BACT|nr:MAG: hypothetical protein UW31_C0017G0004 [Candidatus Collierbacteria bacterium GW2011_GWA2_44_13]KKT51802.1 MAG: hypothetical protein UW44_C0008G0124 [Candidatus Collierbacteria bacterium GW2011_GWB2_44_22]
MNFEFLSLCFRVSRWAEVTATIARCSKRMGEDFSFTCLHRVDGTTLLTLTLGKETLDQYGSQISQLVETCRLK